MSRPALVDATSSADPRPTFSTNLAAIHAKRVTIQPKDVQLARRLRGERVRPFVVVILRDFSLISFPLLQS